MTIAQSKHLAFFHGVAEAAFANPFGPKRQEIDADLAGLGRAAARTKVLETLLMRVTTVLNEYGDIDVAQIPREHRRAVELTLLFHLFHQHVDDFDALILRQSAAGSEPVDVPLGEEIVAALIGFGFAAGRAERLLGLLYQIRRAFYFISQTLAGASPSMQRLRERVWQNIFTDDIGLYESTLWSRMEDFSTFFYGETGTGKGTAAAAIGRAGWIDWNPKQRRFAHGFDDGFVPVHLSQFPESLLESELFGHRKGAFTGAIDAHAGVFARCRPHGTIFLDEIGEVSTPIQIKLLRVLQERLFSPVGSHEEVPFRGRIIAATHDPPSVLRRSGRMRDDFFYRLCSDVIEVPPLRVRLAERPTELQALVERILARTIVDVEEAVVVRVMGAIQALGADYRWPGNVREVEQCVRRVLLTQTYQGDSVAAGAASDWGSLRVSAGQLLARYCATLYAELGSYGAVARIVELDRRTVKRHVDAFHATEVL